MVPAALFSRVLSSYGSGFATHTLCMQQQAQHRHDVGVVLLASLLASVPENSLTENEPSTPSSPEDIFVVAR